MTAEIKSYISACYNVAVCKSGENGVEELRYPLGTGMNKNTILNTWLDTIIDLVSNSRNWRFHMAEMVRGDLIVGASSMAIGVGAAPTNYSQTGLSSFVKSTSFVRPFVSGASMTTRAPLGMRTYSTTYEFNPETSSRTYYEAGLISPFTSPRLASRFLFTNQSGIIGFASGYLNESGNYTIFTGLNASSGYFLNGQQIYFTGNNDLSLRNDFQYGYEIYSPIFNGITGGFSGINNTSSGTGIISGIIGYKNDLSGISVNPGEYIKIKYDVSIRVPALVNPIPVTGTGIIYGDFNGSGQIKLCGSFRDLFGNMDTDGKVRLDSQTPTSPFNLLPSRGRFSWENNPQVEGLMWSTNPSRDSSILSQSSTHFTAGYASGFNSGEFIYGFISGYKNENGIFTGLHILNPSSGSSGYFLNGNKYYFPTGALFSGFSGQTGFIENKNIKFTYTGFAFSGIGSGIPRFSGINNTTSGYGEIIGIIGSRNEIIPQPFPRIDNSANINLIDIGDIPSERRSPLIYKGTANTFYTPSGKFIDHEFIFQASYPSYDIQYGGIFFSPMTATSDGGTPNETVPFNTYGWYWKFDKMQTKYQDQLLKVNFRFSVDRDTLPASPMRSLYVAFD